MGKPTGFLEHPRQGCPAQPPEERVKHWNEFHPTLSEEERRTQGARCMECGVPFCQSGVQLAGMFTGCPLHNLIPEWNDLIYIGTPGLAWERLRKTNCFPEFTGRVCPALCEAACTCGLHGDPVTVRDNELAIVEEAWASGLVAPRPPASAPENGWRWWAAVPRGWPPPTGSTAGATPSPCSSGRIGWGACSCTASPT